jgi:hypothetical protein
VKSLGVAAFALLALLFVGIFALAIHATVSDEDKDPPELAARKAACRDLQAHLFAISNDQQLDQLSPADREKRIAELASGVAIEDIEQCAAADKDKAGSDRKPAALACMLAAQDPAAVRACVPKPPS